MMQYKSVLIACFLLLTLVSMGQDNGVVDNHLPLKAHTYIQNLEFGRAVDYIEKYRLTPQGKKDTLLLEGLGNCYWKLKAYEKAEQCYQTLSLKKDFIMPEVIRLRMADYAAGQKDYNRAKALVDGLKGFEEKANGFGMTDLMMRDSLDFSVKDLTINTTAYREFAPTLIRGQLYFSTNQPENLFIPAVASIDGAQYFHLKQLSDTAESTITTAIKSIKTFGADSVDANKKQRKIALSFEGSDNSLLSRNNMSDDVMRDKKINKEIRSLTETLSGVSAYRFYNVTNFSSAAGSNKVYFTVNQERSDTSAKGRENVHELRIAEAELQGLTLRNIKILPIEMGSNVSLMHPAIHPKGNLLVFSSNASDKQYDLYYTVKDSMGWSSPQALNLLNTKGEEVFSSFTPDGSLYFSSNGRAGLGGLDIYRVKLSIAGGDNKVVQLPYPINSRHDDFGYTVHQNNNDIGYFSSDRNGSDDIFSFKRKQFNVKLEGFVLDAVSGLRKKGVHVMLMEDLSNGNTTLVDSLVTDITGNYRFQSKPNRKYILSLRDSVSIPQMLFIDNYGYTSGKTLPTVVLERTESVKHIPVSAQPASKNTDKAGGDKTNLEIAELTKNLNRPDVKKETASSLSVDVQVPQSASKVVRDNGSASTVNSIRFVLYYQHAKYTFDKEALSALDSLLVLLKSDVTLNAVIGSFTDCTGDKSYNLTLSKKRSNATAGYLASHGIDSSRIIVSHYGEEFLKIDCIPNIYQATKQFLNRRTEVFVTKKSNLSWLDMHNEFLKTK